MREYLVHSQLDARGGCYHATFTSPAETSWLTTPCDRTISAFMRSAPGMEMLYARCSSSRYLYTVTKLDCRALLVETVFRFRKGRAHPTSGTNARAIWSFQWALNISKGDGAGLR